ncbi:MAG TPA: maleylpyruvate isomerase N-terminal domain-containing protein [Acidimicrobiales bacterium]|nr:maleylpyruvate isomerase N-terminal domain-containing protein [Acidimicrobiales bacterium]
MKGVVDVLAEQHAELDSVVSGFDEAAWARPSRCEGWSVSDVVLHLWHSDQLALASVRGDLAPAMPSRLGEVDDLAGDRVAADRGASGAEVHARWKATTEELRAALRSCDPSARLQWVAGDLAARTLATTRLAECWIHTNDIADTTPTDRLVHVARHAALCLPPGRPDDDRQRALPPRRTVWRVVGVRRGRRADDHHRRGHRPAPSGVAPHATVGHGARRHRARCRRRARPRAHLGVMPGARSSPICSSTSEHPVALLALTGAHA